jgi:hypothetical protein
MTAPDPLAGNGGATAIRNTISIRRGNYLSNERSQFPLGVMPSGDARWKLILDVSDADFLAHSGQAPDRPSACPQGMWSCAPRWGLFDMPAGSARAVASTVDRGTDVAPASCIRRLRRTRRRRSAWYLPLGGPDLPQQAVARKSATAKNPRAPAKDRRQFRAQPTMERV